jgi:1-phosphofructokinase family hexose kinase
VILCVAGNPSIDKLFEVERVTPGAIHRPLGFVQVAGGKGLNVARAVARLGADVTAVCVLGGHAGRWVAEALGGEDGVRVRVAWTEAQTRSSLSVAERETGRLTEFYEDGDEIDRGSWAALEGIVGEVSREGVSWITMSGSLPPGAPADGYARVVRAAREAGIATAVDARGEPLRLAVAAGPSVVKVNAAEAGELLDTTVTSDAEALAAARAIVTTAGGDGHASVVTLGLEGAVLVAPDGSCLHGRVDERGPFPVGSGDAFLAGLVVALEAEEYWPAALAMAVGAGAANAEVRGAGRLEPDRAQALAERALIARI